MYDQNGAKVWECELDIYGNIRTLEGRADMCPFRYQGQYHDIETDLYYNRFRYYAPNEGGYISQDPIGLEGGNPTLYGYVKDTNIWIDALGLNCKQRDVDAIVSKHGGRKLPDGRYQMPNKKAAKQAASEIAGDLGSNPKTIRRKDYRDKANTYRQQNSNRVIGKHSANEKAGFHDHDIGHDFDRRPHINAWSENTGTTAKDNIHLYY